MYLTILCVILLSAVSKRSTVDGRATMYNKTASFNSDDFFLITYSIKFQDHEQDKITVAPFTHATFRLGESFESISKGNYMFGFVVSSDQSEVKNETEIYGYSRPWHIREDIKTKEREYYM